GGARGGGGDSRGGPPARSAAGGGSTSPRGPVGSKDDPQGWVLKPDLVAPGNAIVAAGTPGSYLWTNYPESHVQGTGGGTYQMMSGSSISAAMVSGAAALLLQAQPKLTPGQVKFALQFSAEHLKGFGLIEQGAGSLNVPLALGVATSANPLQTSASSVI